MADVARCSACRSLLRFQSDTIGRLLEICDRCRTRQPIVSSASANERFVRCIECPRLIVRRAGKGRWCARCQECHERHRRAYRRREYLRDRQRRANPGQPLRRTSPYGCGEQMRNAKLTDDNVRDMRRRWPAESYTMLALEFGVSRTTIRKAVQRLRWRHVDPPFTPDSVLVQVAS